MNKARRNEKLKTASLYTVLFILTSMSTSALLMQQAFAPPTDCGWEITGVSGPFIYAQGTYSGTQYSRYGVSATQLITNPTVCGTFQSDGSIVANLIAIIGPTTDYIETGYYKGNYTSEGMVSNTVPHYFWGKYYGTNRQYSDISTGTSKYPNVNDWIYFETRGNIDTSNHDWHVKIERTSDYTINIDGLTMNQAYGPESWVELEAHNNKSSATSHFKSITDAKNIGGSMNWVSWGSNSYATWTSDSRNPYRSCKVSDTEFTMYTQ